MPAAADSDSISAARPSGKRTVSVFTKRVYYISDRAARQARGALDSVQENASDCGSTWSSVTKLLYQSGAISQPMITSSPEMMIRACRREIDVSCRSRFAELDCAPVAGRSISQRPSRRTRARRARSSRQGTGIFLFKRLIGRDTSLYCSTGRKQCFATHLAAFVP